MSKLNTFIKQLQTRTGRKFTKQLLLSDMQATISIASKSLAPIAQETAETNKEPNFKSKWTESRNALYLRGIGSRDRTMFHSMNVLIGKAIDVVEELRKFFDKEDDVVIEGLTYQSATAIQLYYVTRWFIDYSKDFLILLYTNEADTVIDDDRALVPFTKAELAEIEDKFDLFIQVSKFFRENYKASLAGYLESLPTMEIKEGDETALDALMGGKGSFRLPDNKHTSKFMMGAGLFVASIVAQQQEKKYRNAQRECETVRLRILQLEILKSQAEQSEDGKADGQSLDSINKQIEYNIKRSREAKKELARLEERYEL